MRWVAVAMVLLFSFHAEAASPGMREAKAVEAVPLRSIAGWLKLYGVEGYVGADVAEVMGIPRAGDTDQLEAKQRGFRSDKTLRIAQFLQDSQYILFMVQGPEQVVFYLSSVREGLKKAFISIPAKNLVAPLDAAEAESSFRLEVLYWEDKAATR